MQKLYYRLFYNLQARVEKKLKFHLLREIYLRRTCKSVGKNVLALGRVQGFHKNVIIKDKCSFNGMRIIEEAEIEIGSYLHLGDNITIITDDHKYDSKTAIPYDKRE